MTIFDGRDYTRKACLKFYFHCGPLKISKCKVQNVGNTKAKADTKCYEKKSHKCEEGGAHLRISFWHLLMNSAKPEKSEF